MTSRHPLLRSCAHLMPIQCASRGHAAGLRNTACVRNTRGRRNPACVHNTARGHSAGVGMGASDSGGGGRGARDTRAGGGMRHLVLSSAWFKETQAVLINGAASPFNMLSQEVRRW